MKPGGLSVISKCIECHHWNTKFAFNNGVYNDLIDFMNAMGPTVVYYSTVRV